MTTPNKPEPSAQDDLPVPEYSWSNDSKTVTFKNPMSPREFAQWQASRAPVVQAGVPEHWRTKAEHIVSGKMNSAESFTQSIMLLRVMLAAAPSAPQSAPLAARDFEYTKNIVPGIKAVLYTDTINDKQVMRDDLWLATTEQLNSLAMIGEGAPQPVAALSEVAATAVALSESVAPQPIAAPAHSVGSLGELLSVKHTERVHIGNYANVSADASAEFILGASQQPVPVPALSIGDEVKFNDLLQNFYKTAYSFAGSAPNPIAKANLISCIDAWAAQLVQQRATLSDEQILMVARQEGMATHDCTLHPMEYAVGYARAILAAAGAA